MLGWSGSVEAATKVISHLVDNAVQHGVMADFFGDDVTVRLSVSEAHHLVIDVCDPNPSFPDFDAAKAGGPGSGLWWAQSLGGDITWFIPPNASGKTVRATMKGVVHP
ncbi:ATP-binding protein [Streptomyces seoulensis]